MKTYFEIANDIESNPVPIGIIQIAVEQEKSLDQILGVTEPSYGVKAEIDREQYNRLVRKLSKPTFKKVESLRDSAPIPSNLESLANCKRALWQKI